MKKNGMLKRAATAALVVGAGVMAAHADPDAAITGLVTDTTTVFTSVKALAITIVTVAIGIRLVRKFAK